MRRTGDHFPPIEYMRNSGGEMNKLSLPLLSLSPSLHFFLTYFWTLASPRVIVKVKTHLIGIGEEEEFNPTSSFFSPISLSHTR